MQGIANNILINAIIFYQRYLSPHKGYSCAHGVYHGRSSCSHWAIRIIKKHGIFMFIPLMIKRLKACHMAYEEIKKEKETNKGKGGVEACPCTNKESAYCCLNMFPFS